MQPGRATGIGTGVDKYDILTALAICGLHRSTTEQISALRLIALITARYNWRRNELSMGQAEMARLWGVNERTAKREVKRLTAMGLLDVRRPGVRGRVASYRLNFEVLKTLSRPAWASVGADFEARANFLLAHVDAGSLSQGAMGSKVLKVDFGGPSLQSEDGAGRGGDPRWRCALQRLAESQPDAFANWYKRLALRQVVDGHVEISAPNGFVLSYVSAHLLRPLTDAVTAAFGDGTKVVLTIAG